MRLLASKQPGFKEEEYMLNHIRRLTLNLQVSNWDNFQSFILSLISSIKKKAFYGPTSLIIPKNLYKHTHTQKRENEYLWIISPGRSQSNSSIRS